MVRLTLGELVVRPWLPTDLDAVWAALQDPAIRRWNDSGARSRADAAGWLARRHEGDDHVSRAVVDGGGVLLGSVSLHSIHDGEAEIGYWVVPAARGRRIAPRVVDAMTRWGFVGLGLERVQLLHDVANTASQRVAELAGFVLEGRLRQSYRYGDGVRCDELLWSRLPDDPVP